MAGTLYLVATPIGNLEDMTFRAIRILKEVDLIAAEDTRNSIKLLNHFEIETPMTSYHEFNKYDKADLLIEKLQAGQNIAVITDAGTPGISDPGEVLAAKCYESGLQVVPIPGAAAVINALIASGQPARRFCFEGFLPQKKGRQTKLTELAAETRTMIFYESPFRVLKTLEQLAECLGNDRKASVSREISKKFEETVRGTLAELVQHFKEHPPKGEFVIVVAGQ